jgi:hypothetical protein
MATQPQLQPDLTDEPPADDHENEIELQGEEQYRKAPWTDDPNEWCRAHIFTMLADANIDGGILVENMDAIYKWIRHGDLPKRGKKL